MIFFKLFGTPLRLKRWRQRLSFTASKVSIQRHLPWPWRLLWLASLLALTAVILASLLALTAVIAWGAYDLGRHLTNQFPFSTAVAEVSSLQQQLDQLQVERNQYSSVANAAESQIQMERSVQKQLLAQVKTLERENAKLKEDLAFFESLLPASKGAQGVSIRRLKAEMIATNQLKYRLLVMQGGKGEREFVGNLQLAVTVVQDGKSAIMVFPDGKTEETEKYKLGFKHYQRMEGVLTLPEGVAIEAVQARILEKGQIRAQQSANL